MQKIFEISANKDNILDNRPDTEKDRPCFKYAFRRAAD